MSNNVMKEALKPVVSNTFSSYVWKGEKKKIGDKLVQETEQIMDMSPERLKECYNHCKKMLFNDSSKHLGRYNVLDEINEQIKKCNIELFLRYCENSYKKNERDPVSRNSLRISLRQFMENTNKKLREQNKKEIEDWNEILITEAASLIPEEFQNISIGEVIDGCIDLLGALDKQHITMTFITKMGVWFNKSEENELEGNSNVEKLKFIKNKLHLPEVPVLRINERGLSYHEMRAVLTLPKKQKYSDMTTIQLITLSTKILPRLQREIDGHIFSWNRLLRQIENVARYKEINLNDQN